MTAPKPYSEAVFIAASRAPAMATLLASEKRLPTRPTGEDDDGQDAHQQRRFHGPEPR